jgi:hypothetical protein
MLIHNPFVRPMFARMTVVATQKRLSSYSSSKATYATVSGASFSGALTPLDDKMQITLGLAGKGFSFVTEGAADIKANDRLVIGSQEYIVQGVSRYSQAGIDILKAILILSIKT